MHARAARTSLRLLVAGVNRLVVVPETALNQPQERGADREEAEDDFEQLVQAAIDEANVNRRDSLEVG